MSPPDQYLLSKDPTCFSHPSLMCHHSHRWRNWRPSNNIYVTALTNLCITLNTSVWCPFSKTACKVCNRALLGRPIDELSSIDDDSQPFRFSTSPTPSRGTTPAFSLGSPTSSQQTPRRTLTRNPNGVYRWQGAGSARPRNRHQSPAFGPPRSTPSKFKLSAPESSPSKADNKRRRLDAVTEHTTPHGISEPLPSTPPREQPSAESSVLSSSTSSLSSSTMNDSSPNKTNAVPATPRLHLSVPPKPTTPAVPSPLRNTWVTGESSSPPQSSPPSKPSQPTRAANFMAELIKEVTPPKKPDLSNPYQTASPVKPSLQKKPTKKRKAAEGRSKEPEKKAVDLSHQTIIEATVPTVSVLHVPALWCLVNCHRRGANALAHPRTSGKPQPRKQTALTRNRPGAVIGSNPRHPLVQMVFTVPPVNEEAMRNQQEGTYPP